MGKARWVRVCAVALALLVSGCTLSTGGLGDEGTAEDAGADAGADGGADDAS